MHHINDSLCPFDMGGTARTFLVDLPERVTRRNTRWVRLPTFARWLIR